MLERKVKIVKDFLGEYQKTKDEYLFYCPKCKHHKPKLSVNFNKGFFKCWVCDYNGRSVLRLVTHYGNSKHKEQWKKVCGIVDMSEVDKTEEKVFVELPKEFVSLTSKNVTPLSIPARTYLKNRGVTYEDIMWWKIGFCPDGASGGRIIVPSFDMDGSVNYFVARNYENDFKKYYNPKVKKDFIFNELYLDWNKDITLVEGVFDAMVARNAIPLLGSTLREDSYIFQRIVGECNTIYIALDADAKKKGEKIIKLLLSYGVEIYKIDTSGYEDVGVMTKETFQQLKTNAAFVSLDNYLLEKLSF